MCICIYVCIYVYIYIYIYILDEKGIQYNYLDMTEMPHKTKSYLRMYCNSFPVDLLTSFSSTNYYPTTVLFENLL